MSKTKLKKIYNQVYIQKNWKKQNNKMMILKIKVNNINKLFTNQKIKYNIQKMNNN